MTDRTILDTWNETTRRSTELIVDGETGLPLIRHTQDVKPILEANKRLANNFTGPNKEGFTLVARIPVVVWNEWRRLGITRDEAALNAALQMRESMYLRTDDRRRL
jgi:hypothetical protein